MLKHYPVASVKLYACGVHYKLLNACISIGNFVMSDGSFQNTSRVDSEVPY